MSGGTPVADFPTGARLMARDRIIPSDFWTWEAVIDCAAMTRLLFLGLWNFADDFGVQPLRPRTIAMQVFPGDAIDTDAIRAMIDELAARGLVRVYQVEEQEYLEIVDWSQVQRVGRRARRRYPGFPSPNEGEEKMSRVSEADEGLPRSTSAAVADEPPISPSSALRAPSPSGPSAAPDLRGEKEDEPTPPASPSALAPPSTPADAPALHR